jgi:hypothetical protein
MTTLSEVQRAVVNLRLVDEVPGENVARQLGTTPAHVAVLLFRAKRALRRCIDEEDAPSSASSGDGPTRRPKSRAARTPARALDEASS